MFTNFQILKSMKRIEITCPITATMSVINGKWKLVILWYLKDGPQRFTALKKLIPECSLKMFNDNLKELEKGGIIERKVFAEVPPRVEYKISSYGLSLLPIVNVLRNWGVQHLVSNPSLMNKNKSLQEMITLITSKETIV